MYIVWLSNSDMVLANGYLYMYRSSESKFFIAAFSGLSSSACALLWWASLAGKNRLGMRLGT